MLSKGLDVRWVDLSWPVKCTYIRVLVYVFNREVFLGAGINPSLALIPWLGFGNGSNAFYHLFQGLIQFVWVSGVTLTFSPAAALRCDHIT